MLEIQFVYLSVCIHVFEVSILIMKVDNADLSELNHKKIIELSYVWLNGILFNWKLSKVCYIDYEQRNDRSMSLD